MGIALPMPFHDSCGCALSHVLGVPFIDVNGHPMIDAPPTVPQVSHRSGLDIRMTPGLVAEVSPLGCVCAFLQHVLQVVHPVHAKNFGCFRCRLR